MRTNDPGFFKVCGRRLLPGGVSQPRSITWACDRAGGAANVQALRCLDWLSFQDMLQERAMRSQDFELLAYPPMALVAVHALFASPIKQPVQFPKRDSEVHFAKLANDNLVQSFYTGLGAAQRRTIDRAVLPLEWLPAVLTILSPELKQVESLWRNGTSARWHRSMLMRDAIKAQEASPLLDKSVAADADRARYVAAPCGSAGKPRAHVPASAPGGQRSLRVHSRAVR